MPFQKLYDKLSMPLLSAYKLGGMALALLLIGALLLLGESLAWFLDLRIRWALLSVGTALIGVVIFHFYLSNLRPLLVVSRSLKANEEFINSVQSTAISLTGIIQLLNDYALVHAASIAESTEAAKDMLKEIPLLEPLASRIFGDKRFQKADLLVRQIRSTSARSREIVGDIANSLETADFRTLKSHVAKLEELGSQLRSALSI